MKTVRVILSSEAEEIFKYLNKQSEKSKTEKTILKAIMKKVEIIKLNPHYGDPLAKRLIPAEYIQKYGVTNLFRVELPNYWRMIYTLTNGESVVEIIAFIIDIQDHGKYDEVFGYRKK